MRCIRHLRIKYNNKFIILNCGRRHRHSCQRYFVRSKKRTENMNERRIASERACAKVKTEHYGYQHVFLPSYKSIWSFSYAYSIHTYIYSGLLLALIKRIWCECKQNNIHTQTHIHNTHTDIYFIRRHSSFIGSSGFSLQRYATHNKNNKVTWNMNALFYTALLFFGHSKCKRRPRPRTMTD